VQGKQGLEQLVPYQVLVILMSALFGRNDICRDYIDEQMAESNREKKKN
jgi:hypothetical protein